MNRMNRAEFFDKMAGLDEQRLRKETSLATVLNEMLTVPDAWVTFAGHYLDALDRIVAGDNARDQSWRSDDFAREQRTADLARWHAMLLQRLADTETEDLLDRLMEHRVLGGPELDFLRARLASGATPLQLVAS